MKNNLKMLRINLLCILTGLLLTACGSKEGEQQTSDIPDDFSTLSDTQKIQRLIDAKVTTDSIAHFVTECLDGRHPGVTIKDPDAVMLYVGEKLGDEEMGNYAMSFDMYLQALSPASKYKTRIAMPATDRERLGYDLGLEYVNQVVDKKLTIGQVDRDVTALQRAAATDEDTYENFLTGFAEGIKLSADRGIPTAVISKYGR